MAQRASRPFIGGRIRISVVCEAKRQSWDDNVSGCTTKIATDHKCVFSCHSRASCAELVATITNILSTNRYLWRHTT